MIKFIRKLFSTDEKADFYAKIACALFGTSNRSIDDELLNNIANRLPVGNKAHFIERIKYHLDLMSANDLHINQLIKRINIISRNHPHWIMAVSVSFLEEFVDESSDLNMRVFEYLQNLKTHKMLVYAGEEQKR